MIQAVIWDMDGTLVDSMSMWREVGVRLLRSLKVTPEENLAQKLFAMSMKEGITYLKDTYHLEISEDEIMERMEEIVIAFYENEVTIKGSVVSCLEKLKQKGIKMALATATNRGPAQKALKHCGIEDYFTVFYTCEEAGADKMKPDIYLKCSEELAVPVENTLVVEDAIHALRTAKQAGYHTAGIYDAQSVREQDEIRKLSDVYVDEQLDYEVIMEWLNSQS